MNGTRSNSVNWQIEGTDNNDLWWNIPAVNQGGVSAIAGVVLPMDAIEKFSFVTAGSTETGPQSGRHGQPDRSSPEPTGCMAQPTTTTTTNSFSCRILSPGQQGWTRNQHIGFSLGGPILEGQVFFFMAGEHQGFLIGAEIKATEPSAAYQAEALPLLECVRCAAQHGCHESAERNGDHSALWPAAAFTGPASLKLYGDRQPDRAQYNSLVKFDYLSERTTCRRAGSRAKERRRRQRRPHFRLTLKTHRFMSRIIRWSTTGC